MRLFPVLALPVFLMAAGLSAAQTIAPDAIELARTHLAAGRLPEARAALRAVPVSAESSRLAADIALAGGDLRAALDAYDLLAGRFKTPAPDVLRTVAVKRAAELRHDRDPRVRVDACDVLLATGEGGDCATWLNQTAMHADVDAGTRIAAARVLELRGERGGPQLVDLVIRTVMSTSPAAAAGALASVPAARSNEALKTLAFSENRDARYLATRALAARRTRDVLPTLRTIAADDSAGPIRLLAHIGLAGTGDPESVRFVRAALPQLDGRERLDAALALRLSKAPDANAVLAELTSGVHEMVRIDAAEAIYESEPRAAEAAIVAGQASGNPWIRARALEATASLRLEATPVVRRAMLDGNAAVAIAATRAVVASLAKSPRP